MNHNKINRKKFLRKHHHIRLKRSKTFQNEKISLGPIFSMSRKQAERAIQLQTWAISYEREMMIQRVELKYHNAK